MSLFKWRIKSNCFVIKERKSSKQTKIDRNLKYSLLMKIINGFSNKEYNCDLFSIHLKTITSHTK